MHEPFVSYAQNGEDVVLARGCDPTTALGSGSTSARATGRDR